MSKNVFANGNEISAKKDGNKSICAMPDVCLSPPSPPAGPIPIPYPNTSAASKTSGGSKSVKIGGQEVGLKNKSFYKKSNGDEAATKSLGMGIVSHNIQGKMEHVAWSMDVQFEGKNVIRHMDLTTHNHVNSTNGGVVLNRAKEKRRKNLQLNCQELGALNKEAREKQIKKTAQEKPFTVTTASRTDYKGKTKFMKAATPKDVPFQKYQSGYQKTIDKDKKTIACSPTPHSPRRKHDTEPKLLEPEWPMGGTIKMKIFHQDKDGVDSMPCSCCKKVICETQKCGLNIILCNKRNQEVKAEDLCKDGKPKPVGGTGKDKDAFWASKGL